VPELQTTDKDDVTKPTRLGEQAMVNAVPDHVHPRGGVHRAQLLGGAV